MSVGYETKAGEGEGPKHQRGMEEGYKHLERRVRDDVHQLWGRGISTYMGGV